MTDSKSVGSDTVWVRVPPPAPEKKPLLSTKTREVFLLLIPPSAARAIVGTAVCVQLNNLSFYGILS